MFMTEIAISLLSEESDIVMSHIGREGKKKSRSNCFKKNVGFFVALLLAEQCYMYLRPSYAAWNVLFGCVAAQ